MAHHWWGRTRAAVEVGDDTESTRDQHPDDVDAERRDDFCPILNASDEYHREDEEDGTSHEGEGRDHTVNHQNSLHAVFWSATAFWSVTAVLSSILYRQSARRGSPRAAGNEVLMGTDSQSRGSDPACGRHCIACTYCSRHTVVQISRILGERRLR